jgi:DNA uptake protein ComE-like DNA-binding protein
MGLADRDYMHRRPSGGDDGGWPFSRALTIAAVIMVIVVAGLWLYRHGAQSGHAEGSLRVNINTAKQTEIESLPGIGPAIAALVIAGRPYAKVTDLARVRGISEKQVLSLQPLLTITEATQRADGR